MNFQRINISDKRAPPKIYKLNKKMHLRTYKTPPPTQHIYSQLHTNILHIKYFERNDYPHGD